MIDVSELGLLRAVVHRDTGEIELENGSPIPIEFDFYQLTSPSQSLNPAGWNSLSEQEFQAIGSGEGETWAEAGGSDSGDLAELFLRSASSLASSAAVSLGNAYNSQINGEDLVLSYRLPDGTFEVGLVEYMGEASAGISGDYNGSGLVEQADLDLVLGNWGADGTVPPPTWINDPPTGFIDQEELDGVLGNWGSMSGGGSLASAASVPEPTTLMLVVAAVLPLIAVRRVRFAG
jgi:hypothetical protein